MNCPQCGNDVPAGAPECLNCHTPLPNPANPPTPANRPNYDPALATSGMAIAAFIVSLVGFVVPYIGQLVALILGLVALVQINKHPERLKGRVFAIAGIVISGVGIFLLQNEISHERMFRDKPRQTTCLSQIRQIATAAQMYDQDNNGHFPGIAFQHWDAALGAYFGNDARMFTCPSDSAATVNDNFNSYGYNGMLVRADGNGVNESVINDPTEVALLCDASPTMAFGDGGLVGGGALTPIAQAVIPSPRHSNGTVVGYCDGHASYVPNGYNPRDTSSALTQGFFMCSALGQIQNPVGGLGQFTLASTTPNATRITIGGDMATMPMLTAAAQAWKQLAGADYHTHGFLGMGVTKNRPANYVWGYADGAYVAGAGEFPIGKDALVFIVSKNTRIPASYFDGGSVNGVYVASPTALQALLTGNGGTGYQANAFQCYGYDACAASLPRGKTYAPRQGNTRFLNKLGMTTGTKAVLATDDQNMVTLVGADPYGIGFCSSAMADPNQVQILGIRQPGGNAANAGFYPQSNPKYRYIMPAQAALVSIPPQYIRQLYAVARGAAASKGDHSAFADSMLATGSPGLTAIQAGPLFQASYFKQ